MALMITSYSLGSLGVVAASPQADTAWTAPRAIASAMQRAHFILYVRDQAASTRFYSSVLGSDPVLDVPGMTEFRLNDAILGLMPIAGIRRLLGDALPNPDGAAGIPRAELYLVVDDPAAYHRRALEAGAREMAPLALRDWGHWAAYSLDPDAHVLAFARAANSE